MVFTFHPINSADKHLCPGDSTHSVCSPGPREHVLCVPCHSSSTTRGLHGTTCERVQCARCFSMGSWALPAILGSLRCATARAPISRATQYRLPRKTCECRQFLVLCLLKQTWTAQCPFPLFLPIFAPFTTLTWVGGSGLRGLVFLFFTELTRGGIWKM